MKEDSCEPELKKQCLNNNDDDPDIKTASILFRKSSNTNWINGFSSTEDTNEGNKLIQIIYLFSNFINMLISDYFHRLNPVTINQDYFFGMAETEGACDLFDSSFLT